MATTTSTTRPIRITELKHQLAAAILTVDRIAAQNSNDLSADDASTLDNLDSQLNLLQDPLLLNRVNAKQRKLERHKAWRKRRVDNALKRQEQISERRKRLEADLERWQQQKSAQDMPTKKKKKTSKRKSTSRVRELERTLDLLLQLRDLRRKRLEAQGHFFPETGDDFYAKIQEQEKRQPRNDESPYQEEEEQEEKQLYIHPDDHWHNTGLDHKAYAYWCQGEQDVDTLRRIRNQWDGYLVEEEEEEEEESAGTKIPPVWVEPGPPSNWIWATALDH